MTDARPTPSLFDKLKTFANQVYFLRFPILTWLALIGLPFLGLKTDLKSLLAGLFVSDAMGIFRISAVAFTTAGTVLVTWQLIATHGKARFGREHLPAAQAQGFPVRLWQALLAGAGALPVTIAVVYKTLKEASEVSAVWAVSAAVAGLSAALTLFFVAALVQLLLNSEGRAKQLARENFIVRWLPDALIDKLTAADPMETPRRGLRTLLQKIMGPGFFEESSPSSTGGRFLPGHGLAASLLAVSLTVFILAGQFSQYEMPALFFVILLLMLLCWGLSGLSFAFDRYRVPVLLVLLLIAYFSRPGYFYKSETGKTLAMLTPAEVIGDQPRKIVIVATEGGGIQAAAWTARVLTGIQKQQPEFGSTLRLISSVSGGSTGAMFFVNGYNDAGSFDPKSLELIVQMAEGNSLDDVARGMVYHDFFELFLFGFWPFGVDRGTALEDAWGKSCRKVCGEYLSGNPAPCPVNCEMTGSLASWAADVKAGKRPANIFNATLVEDGDRLLASNSDVRTPIDRRGRQNLVDLLKGRDLPAVTAARLSAAFPYVSPAARTTDEDCRPDAKCGARYHVVDGGYYDNYGMTSVVEWLNEALAAKTSDGKDLLSEVLVIQIQSFPESSSKKPAPGYVSQALAPLLTLLNIRTSAQASHKAIETHLLEERWPKRVKTVPFRFCCLPSEGETPCYDPPLTWKLTQGEKNNISACWDNGSQTASLKIVQDFLKGMTGQPVAQVKAVAP